MGSRFTEAFDSLGADDNTKRERTERIMSEQSVVDNQVTEQMGAVSAAKARLHLFSGRRGIAIITAIALFFAVAVSIPLGIIVNNSRGLLNAMSRLKNTYVDMDGVAAFGVWNAPDSSSASARISGVSYINTASSAVIDDGNDGGVISGEWSDDERYDWESDYDWDPTKANVLIAISEDGKIDEVVYERTNGRGQVRQDVLGNAAMVYVSNGFTYVMYVDDAEWEFWKNINFAQEMCSPNGFHCHHESMQTVVIHNATGKVFALKDIIPQVNELSGAINYTMQAYPFKDDLLYISPLYGNYIPQWYNVIYDEQTESIRYDFIIPADVFTSYGISYNISAVRRDKYGQQYLLAGNGSLACVPAGIVNLPSYDRYDNSIIFSTPNGIMLGTDGRAYAFDGGKLKVFGENFELSPVEEGIEVAFEGIADDFGGRLGGVNDGIAYKLKDGYIYSMFGEVWKVDADGNLQACDRLEGSFPRFADDGYLIGGEIIAFVDTALTGDGRGSINGRMVQINFDCIDGTPVAVATHIIIASEISVRYNHRMVIEQNKNPWSSERGDTRYFLLTVQNGTPDIEYFAYGYNGGVRGLTNPITEPLVL